MVTFLLTLVLAFHLRLCWSALPTCINPTDGGVSTCSDVDLRSRDFWRSIAEAAGASNLHIDKANSTESLKKLTKTASTKGTAAHRKSMLKDGWATLTPDDWAGNPEIVQTYLKDLAKVAEEINVAKELPANFLLIYDEPFEIVHALTAYLQPVYGLKPSHDIFVFYAKPGYPGWPVHRDGGEYDNILSFQKQEPYRDLPTYTTTWLAVTDATEETSHMSYLPAHADRDYALLNHPTGQDDNLNFEEDDMGSIRAAGRKAIRSSHVSSGTALSWSHRTLHWSTAAPLDAPHARLSMTLSLGKFHLDPPALKHSDLKTVPPFEARVAMVCYTGVAYHYNFHSTLQAKVFLMLDILADHRFAQHLTDEALSPRHERELGSAFISYLEAIYTDAEQEGVQTYVENVARYIVHERGLETSPFMEDLAKKSPADNSVTEK